MANRRCRTYKYRRNNSIISKLCFDYGSGLCNVIICFVVLKAFWLRRYNYSRAAVILKILSSTGNLHGHIAFDEQLFSTAQHADIAAYIYLWYNLLACDHRRMCSSYSMQK